MTRKILVPVNIDKPDEIIKDVLYPKLTENGYVLTGIKTDKKVDFGMVIPSKKIDENDLFRKIVDSGVKIESVQNLLDTLKSYVEKIPNYKIGNILEIDNSKSKFEFELKYQRLPRKK